MPKDNETYIWNFFKKKGFNDYAIAGLMGNLLAESKLDPTNLQDTYNRSLGMTDKEYTLKVDNGQYKQFVHDSAGYGLAQWTWWSRKQALLSYAKRKRTSIGNLETQLEFLVQEIEDNFQTTYKVLKNAKSIEQACIQVLKGYEAPYDSGPKTQSVRIGYSQSIYKRQTTQQKGDKNMSKYTKGVPVKLSEHFNSGEMDCHGHGCCSETLITPKLIDYLEAIREHFNKPITITSGYRCPIHNRNVGGATGSRHSKGDAADIVVQGVSPRQVAQFAESYGILGIGLYETSKDGFFVHIDTRDYKSFWYGQRQEPRTTFGGNPENKPSPNPNQPSTVYTVGSSGSGVKKLQEDLIKLGYNLDPYGADGQYGQGTADAVKKFQKDNHLNADGIAGPETLSVIEKKLNNIDEGLMVVTASGLNVRQSGNIKAPIVGAVYKGQKVKVLERKDGWGRIEKPAGWVSLDYLKTL